MLQQVALHSASLVAVNIIGTATDTIASSHVTCRLLERELFVYDESSEYHRHW
jgi:hypothetical protein